MNLKYKNKQIHHEVLTSEKSSTIFIDKKEYQVRKIENNSFIVSDGVNSFAVNFAENKNKIYSQISSENFQLEVNNEMNFLNNSNSDITETKESIFAPMPGNVLKVLIKEGDLVSEGQSLMIIEAMKMENTIYAPHSGKIIKLNAIENSQVDIDNPIVIIEKE